MTMEIPNLPWLEGLSVLQLVGRLESHYQLECEAGPLKNCVEWMGLRNRLKKMAALVPDTRAPAE